MYFHEIWWRWWLLFIHHLIKFIYLKLKELVHAYKKQPIRDGNDEDVTSCYHPLASMESCVRPRAFFLKREQRVPWATWRMGPLVQALAISSTLTEFHTFGGVWKEWSFLSMKTPYSKLRPSNGWHIWTNVGICCRYWWHRNGTILNVHFSITRTENS